MRILIIQYWQSCTPDTFFLIRYPIFRYFNACIRYRYSDTFQNLVVRYRYSISILSYTLYTSHLIAVVTVPIKIDRIRIRPPNNWILLKAKTPLRAGTYRMCHRKFNFEDITVLLLGDCFYVYWLEFPQVRSLKILWGSGGRPWKVAKSMKNLEKAKHICSNCGFFE
jgi:hypothetical protein